MTRELPKLPTDVPFRIVDLFAGPGGLDIAAHALQIPSIGVELDPGAIATRTAAGLLTAPGNVLDYGPHDFREANVLAGGPPCQTFTVAGNGDGRRDLETVKKSVRRLKNRDKWADVELGLVGLDERTKLVLQPLRWILTAIDDESLTPYDAVILEQVPAVIEVWEEYAEVLVSEGYAVDFGVLRTEQFGVPQTRRRAILIARRGVGKGTVKLPKAKHAAYRPGDTKVIGSTLTDHGMWTCMSEALPHRTEEFTVVSNYSTGGNSKERGRRQWNQPSATITGKVSRNRVEGRNGEELPRFASWEAGMLQTFPAKYPWMGKDVSQQIGNAVPPRLAMHIICAALGKSSPMDEDFDRLMKWEPPTREGDGVENEKTATTPVTLVSV